MTSTMTLFAFVGGLGFGEIAIILLLGVLLFGRKLPDVGRYLGKGIVEFKKGIKGIEDDVESSAPASQAQLPAEPPKPPQKVQTTAPKFEDSPSNVTTPPQV